MNKIDELIAKVRGVKRQEIIDFLMLVENMSTSPSPEKVGTLSAKAFLLASEIKHFGVNND
jgi:hypothetical protein